MFASVWPEHLLVTSALHSRELATLIINCWFSKFLGNIVLDVSVLDSFSPCFSATNDWISLCGRIQYREEMCRSFSCPGRTRFNTELLPLIGFALCLSVIQIGAKLYKTAVLNARIFIGHLVLEIKIKINIPSNYYKSSVSKSFKNLNLRTNDCQKQRQHFNNKVQQLLFSSCSIVKILSAFTTDGEIWDPGSQ